MRLDVKRRINTVPETIYIPKHPSVEGNGSRRPTDGGGKLEWRPPKNSAGLTSRQYQSIILSCLSSFWSDDQRQQNLLTTTLNWAHCLSSRPSNWIKKDNRKIVKLLHQDYQFLKEHQSLKNGCGKLKCLAEPKSKPMWGRKATTFVFAYTQARTRIRTLAFPGHYKKIPNLLCITIGAQRSMTTRLFKVRLSAAGTLADDERLETASANCPRISKVQHKRNGLN